MADDKIQVTCKSCGYTFLSRAKYSTTCAVCGHGIVIPRRLRDPNWVDGRKGRWKVVRVRVDEQSPTAG